MEMIHTTFKTVVTSGKVTELRARRLKFVVQLCPKQLSDAGRAPSPLWASVSLVCKAAS